MKYRYFIKYPWRLPAAIIVKLPYFKFIRDTLGYQCFIPFGMWFAQKILNIGGNRRAYWPVHFTSKVYAPERIMVGVDAYPGYMGGCYIQGIGGIRIGDYTQIAPNVSIVSSNHDIYDSRKNHAKEISIGKYCWIGAGAIILPGVVLGDWTIVAAGAVVSKSFPNGKCVIGGVPAKEIKFLDESKCVAYEHSVKYNGYIAAAKFEKFRAKKLHI